MATPIPCHTWAQSAVVSHHACTMHFHILPWGFPSVAEVRDNIVPTGHSHTHNPEVYELSPLWWTLPNARGELVDNLLFLLPPNQTVVIIVAHVPSLKMPCETK